MALPDMGLTFSPATSMDRQQHGGPTDPNANVQEAIRTLSLRLPSIVGAKSIAPAALLSGAGSQGLMTPGAQQGAPMGLAQILQRLFGAGSGGGSMPTPGGSMPTPNVIPGVGNTSGPDPHIGVITAPDESWRAQFDAPRFPSKPESDVRYNES